MVIREVQPAGESSRGHGLPSQPSMGRGGGEERVDGAYHGYSCVEYYGNYIDGTLV